MAKIPVDELRRFATDILIAAGTPGDLASIVGESLVDANLAGHDSHGVLRLLGYIRSARDGQVVPAVYPAVTHRDRATARVDGAWGWGQPAMHLAADTAIELARDHGISCVVVNRCYHIGRIWPYVEKVARAGLIGIAMSNAGPAVAPEGGRRRMLGTNPFGWAVPRGDGKPPLSFDFATAAIAEGKLQVAIAKGEPVKRGLLVSAEGRQTTNPHDFYSGGAIRPFGGHKGYGVNLMLQVLGAGLAGMDTSKYDGPAGANGPLIIVIDIAPFVDPAVFAAEVESLRHRILGSPPAEGVDEVLLPGDRSARYRRERASGVPIPDRVWTQLIALADELNVLSPTAQ